MALNIKNPEVDRLAREVAALSGRSITEAIEDALRNELARLNPKRNRKSAREHLSAMRDALKKFPLLDPRHPDQILYDDLGLPR